ncbi:organic cation transporter protein-like [Schistocerca piceifrons]|uniref:organic cation transporter protein-like n=1 Tax=Schistocerca piceifrons TaxID=274613 RepID=UPI001F5FE3B6|nr:organic cation transporter protein-like [Schistocerca piceifrons]
MPPQQKNSPPSRQKQADDKEAANGGVASRPAVPELVVVCSSKTPSPEDAPLPQPPADQPEKLLDFDDVLPHMGEFGVYQKGLFILLAPFAFFVAFVYFTQIFVTLTPENHWCKVPELMNLSIEQRKALAIPPAESGGFSKCREYALDWAALNLSTVQAADPAWPTRPCSRGWEFDSDEVPYSTIAMELEWVCDKSALGSVAQSVFFAGAILGGVVFGWVADHWGRIPALVGTNAVGAAAGIATAFASSFWAFCLCRFLVGLAFDNCFTMMYILVLEYVGPQWRTFVANMSIALYFTLASCLLPWIAYFVADWKLLCIATSVPLLLALVTPWVVPESARWLVSQGKIDKALRIMKKFEKINGKKIDPQIYKDFEDSCHKICKEEEQDKSYSVLDLFRTPRLRRITILLIIIWMAISLCFDGHVRNVGSLGLDVFVTFTIASATELPADTFLTMVLDRWGRRWLACGSMVLSGVFSLLASAVPTGIASASLAIMGRFSVNISYNIGLQYAAELLPTVVRAQGVALIHIMGYVATLISPFVVYLAVVSPVLPLIVLGAIGVVGGALSLYLPETLDKELPQTLRDGEQFGLGQRLLDFPCCGKKPEAKDAAAAVETGKEASPPASPFQRGLGNRASLRASIRGETYRSSMILRSSVRSRRAASPPDASTAAGASVGAATQPDAV